METIAPAKITDHEMDAIPGKIPEWNFSQLAAINAVSIAAASNANPRIIT